MLPEHLSWTLLPAVRAEREGGEGEPQFAQMADRSSHPVAMSDAFMHVASVGAEHPSRTWMQVNLSCLLPMRPTCFGHE